MQKENENNEYEIINHINKLISELDIHNVEEKEKVKKDIMVAIKLPHIEWDNKYALFIIDVTKKMGLDGLESTLSRESGYHFTSDKILRHERDLTEKDYELLRKSILMSYSFQVMQ